LLFFFAFFVQSLHNATPSQGLPCLTCECLQLGLSNGNHQVDLPEQVTGLPALSVISAGKVTAPLFLMSEFKNEAK
jgi:hypothetical protein